MRMILLYFYALLLFWSEHGAELMVWLCSFLLPPKPWGIPTPLGTIQTVNNSIKRGVSRHLLALCSVHPIAFELGQAVALLNSLPLGLRELSIRERRETSTVPPHLWSSKRFLLWIRWTFLFCWLPVGVDLFGLSITATPQPAHCGQRQRSKGEREPGSRCSAHSLSQNAGNPSAFPLRNRQPLQCRQGGQNFCPW